VSDFGNLIGVADAIDKAGFRAAGWVREFPITPDKLMFRTFIPA